MSDIPRTLTEAEQLELRNRIRVESEERDQQERDFIDNALTAQKVCDRANELGYWIYNPENKIWYTPDEFLQVYEKYYLNHPLFHRVKIIHPNEGVKAGYKQLDILQEKLRAFSLKIIEYYSGQ
jgi:hypothetical protein